MKATITKSELLVILSERFNVNVTSFEIFDAIPSGLADKIEKAIRPLEYWEREKLPAIKLLIAVTDFLAFAPFKHALGLADAKWAVEHFDEFISFVRHNDRLPAPRFSTEGMH